MRHSGGVAGPVGRLINGGLPRAKVEPMLVLWVYLDMLGTEATCSLSCHSDPVD